ncbi:MAG: DUF86 domain-containing protein [Gemmatimonas sp.]|jgi:uncharacterized protein with HEPN domain|uniref:HepT-like ribonuclease domain-containing protein n=1 Tax=Gemmatimonas sp. TaxID=1962908 RepID=UPI00391F64F1|nr:DUF86 domain-containing protein [Gemmatimonadota bacterium]
MSYAPREFLRHILIETEFLVSLALRLTRLAPEQDPTLPRDVVRSLKRIGEAAKRVPVDIREANRQIAWRSMAGMRDCFILDRFGVDLDIVWDVLQDRIPTLRDDLHRLLSPEHEDR